MLRYASVEDETEEDDGDEAGSNGARSTRRGRTRRPCAGILTS